MDPWKLATVLLGTWITFCAVAKLGGIALHKFLYGTWTE